MSLLALDAGPDGVTAVVVEPDGTVTARARHALARSAPRPGWVELAPEEIWQATLGAARTALEGCDARAVRGVGVTGRGETLLLWDSETLGAARPAIAGDDARAADLPGRLRWLREHEPHTWALVEAGRYVIGPVESYLVARMTRGTYHLTDVSAASRAGLLDLATDDWSAESCALAGLPREALPELVPTWGPLAATDPPSFLRLSLPLTAVAADHAATLAGLACLGQGDAGCTVGAEAAAVVHAGTRDPGGAGASGPVAAWRTPSGETARARSAVGRSTPETVADLVRTTLTGLPQPSAVRVGGPGADDARCQRLADLLGVPLERGRVRETTAHGAALLAGLGAGVWSSPADLRHAWRLDRRFEPSR